MSEHKKKLYEIMRKHKYNLLRMLKGHQVQFTELQSATLDKDDVEIAKWYLRHKGAWYDDEAVSQFENSFKKWNSSKYAFSFLGGREALVTIIKALELKPGDEVVIPGYTCVVVANAFVAHNIKIIYCDIELDTYGLHADILQQKITKNTKAILIHHLYGLVCRDYERLISLAKNNNITVIEDCAQATGAMYKGIKVGNYGDVSFYSSEQTKIFNTAKGGVAVTNDENIGERLFDIQKKSSIADEDWIDRHLHTILLNYFQFKHPHRYFLGDIYDFMYGNKRLKAYADGEFSGRCDNNYVRQMPAPIAKLALNQLNKIDHYNSLRRETVHKWNAWCDNNGYKRPLIIEESEPVYLRYPVLVEEEKKRNSSWAREELGVNLGVWYVTHMHPTNWPVTGCPNADTAVKHCVNFPTLMT